ncbi:hypothetical protein H6P81_001385 [Aristolochia fimbriata]|uniref:Uncharacterized protein n=1 Tax=Aristolochia fimbriata TaxID=158543 RepID=A0AAV7F6V4_ARIFI|nr:hypothetical protein H6P81_001385 [Aristolochia fimbriata]
MKFQISLVEALSLSLPLPSFCSVSDSLLSLLKFQFQISKLRYVNSPSFPPIETAKPRNQKIKLPSKISSTYNSHDVPLLLTFSNLPSPTLFALPHPAVALSFTMELVPHCHHPNKENLAPPLMNPPPPSTCRSIRPKKRLRTPLEDVTNFFPSLSGDSSVLVSDPETVFDFSFIRRIDRFVVSCQPGMDKGASAGNGRKRRVLNHSDELPRSCRLSIRKEFR